jgi:ATP-binding cassette subfamily B protein
VLKLKKAPILILDEATSQLDSVTEREIQESFWKLIQESSTLGHEKNIDETTASIEPGRKTVIVIAHRLSTLLQMDRILVFDQGKIVEDGNHQELLEKGGLYKMLWGTQVDGFLPDRKQKISLKLEEKTHDTIL